jgi:hypothetical protein
MGRPIKKKFFGSLTTPFQNQARGGRTGVGAESVSTITISNTGTLYSQGTTVAFSAPNIAGGIQATGVAVIPLPGATNAGGITSITITNPGTGYTSAPTLTISTASQVTQYVTNSGVTATFTMSVASVVGIQVGMRVYGGGNGGIVTAVDPVLNRVTSDQANASSWTNANNLKFYDQGSAFAKTVALSTSTQDAIQIISFITTGSSAVSGGDIMKQEASKRYLVQNSQGQGICRLTTGTLTAGTMHIIATDSAGDTYWVTKLTGRKANVFPRSNTGTSIYSNIRVAPWTIGSASGATTGTAIISLSHTN